MNAWKNNNLLPTDKETFINAKMNNLMNFLNAEDLSSNKEIVNEIHFDESMNLKEATKYYAGAYNFSASKFYMTLDELEDEIKTDFEKFSILVSQDKGIQKRYPGVVYSKDQWLEKINYLRENIEFYKPRKFGTQYVKGYRSITLNKYLDFNQDHPGICWAWNKTYQKYNEADFILDGTGHGSRYLLRLKAAFKNSDVDWVKTVYLIRNNEGELRLHPKGKAYILDKLIYSIDDMEKEKEKEKELEIENIAADERKRNLNSAFAFKKYYNPKTKRYDIVDTTEVKLIDVYENGEFILPIGIWKGSLDLSDIKSFKNCPVYILGNFSCCGCKKITSLEGAPKEVEGDFKCNKCPSLTSLKGAPEKVGGNFNCEQCPNLTSLEGAPKEVGGDFNCWKCGNLTSLEGAPKHVGGKFNCQSLYNITSLVGAPKEVGGDFDCIFCINLTSLVGSPEKVGRNFSCDWCNSLTSLEGAPGEVGGNLSCGSCGKEFTEEEIRAACDVKGRIYC